MIKELGTVLNNKEDTIFTYPSYNLALWPTRNLGPTPSLHEHSVYKFLYYWSIYETLCLWGSGKKEGELFINEKPHLLMLLRNHVKIYANFVIDAVDFSFFEQQSNTFCFFTNNLWRTKLMRLRSAQISLISFMYHTILHF